MENTFVDFRIVKQQITIQAVLDHYNIRLRRANQHSLRGGCPLPTHSSEKSTESFSVQTAKNIWACQSTSCAATRQGKRGGNILDFVSIMENCSIRDAANQLHDWFLVAPPLPPRPTVQGSEPKEKPVAKNTGSVEAVLIKKPLTFTLKDIDSSHPYLRQRGLKDETAKQFGVGLFSGRGSMSDRVVIPISNERGELVAYAGRSIDGSEPKYKLPAGFQKSAVLFNLDHVRELSDNARVPLIVVEGFFDCMKVHQAGIQHVVALMGSSMSDAQQHLLHQFERVILFLDGDDAGRSGAQAIAPRLMYRTFVKLISPPDGKQPDQLSSVELKNILGPF